MPKKKQHKYKSKLEVATARQLDELGIKYGYETRKLNYRRRVVNGECGGCASKHVYQRRTYLPDFVISEGLVLEAKGILDASTRAKMLAVQEYNPDVEIRFVFGANNKLNKKKEKRYSDWCIENGFKFCIKRIPPNWF